MYAVIQSGGKQYRVTPGQILQVEKLEGDVGNPVSFDQVLMVAQPNGDQASEIWLGKPLLSGAKVEAEIVGQGRGEKIVIVKMKRRKQYRRTQGHRQAYTQVLVTEMTNGSGAKAGLSADEKSTTLSKFRTNLKPKGLAFSPKLLGSRKKRIAAFHAGETEAAPAKAAAPKKTASPAKKKAAPKKSKA